MFSLKGIVIEVCIPRGTSPVKEINTVRQFNELPSQFRPVYRRRKNPPAEAKIVPREIKEVQLQVEPLNGTAVIMKKVFSH